MRKRIMYALTKMILLRIKDSMWLENQSTRRVMN